MKIVVAYVTGGLKPETMQAIREHWSGDVRMHHLPKDDPFAYVHLLNHYWHAEEDFAVVEQDIVIREDVVTALRDCWCEYGCFPYAWKTDVGPALGCTWFRASFLKMHPRAMSEVVATRVSWRQLDVVLMRHILARRCGEQPHVHLPAVEHLNEEKQLLPEASPVPMMTVPEW